MAAMAKLIMFRETPLSMMLAFASRKTEAVGKLPEVCRFRKWN
jgi:hypothetical protein